MVFAACDDDSTHLELEIFEERFRIRLHEHEVASFVILMPFLNCKANNFAWFQPNISFYCILMSEHLWDGGE